MLSLLRKMVEIESPSDDKAALDRMGAFLAEIFERIGGKVTSYPQKEAGNHLKAEFAGGTGFAGGTRANPLCCWDTLTRYGPWARWPTCRSAFRTGALTVRAFMT